MKQRWFGVQTSEEYARCPVHGRSAAPSAAGISTRVMQTSRATNRHSREFILPRPESIGVENEQCSSAFFQR